MITINYLPQTDSKETQWSFPDYASAVAFMESRMCKSCMCKSKEGMASYMQGYSDKDIEIEWKYTSVGEGYDSKDAKGKFRALMGTGCGCEYDWDEK